MTNTPVKATPAEQIGRLELVLHQWFIRELQRLAALLHDKGATQAEIEAEQDHFRAEFLSTRDREARKVERFFAGPAPSPSIH